MHPFIKILLILSTFFLSACDKPDKRSVLSEHYEVIDSGLISGGDSINWMDNNRIILRAIDPNKPSKGKNYIWEIDTNKIIEYGDGGMPCYYKGYIQYAYKTDLKLTKEKPYGTNWKEGPIYKEKLFTKIYSEIEGRKWHKDNVRNKFSCRLNKRPKEMTHHIWVPLLEEHGYLEFGLMGRDMFSDESIFLHKANGEVVQLPFKRKDVYPFKGQYVPFKNAYFYWAHLMTEEQRQSWITTNCSDGWWIFPESGTAESECIPYTPWKKSHLVKPTKMGLFMVSDNYQGNDPRESGGYLYTDKHFIKVIKGQIREARISPDGCKVAVTHKLGSHINNKVKMTLKVVNICEEKN